MPEIIKERLDTELGFLKDEQFASQYLLAKKLVDYAKEKGKLTTARGAVGSILMCIKKIVLNGSSPLRTRSFGASVHNQP